MCRKRRLQRIISPTRNDAFAMGDQTPDASVRTYADIMREQNLARERDNTMQVHHPALCTTNTQLLWLKHATCFSPTMECSGPPISLAILQASWNV